MAASPNQPPQQYSSEPGIRVREIEDKLNLLKNRILLIGQSHVDEREKNFIEIQQLKKELILVKEENTRIRELLQRITEQLTNSARKEELAIIQRQLDLLRK
ncbi:MAG: hypothetical protein Q7S27_04295 [Nanoarchaeota archaeon]|nr:hypothetical protein [Nanoarchaeota archaeon]